MTKIKPFRAVIYNQEKIKDISRIVCPPYDVISKAKQQRYHDADPHNFIHILLGNDSPLGDKYERAGNYFREWLENGVLIRDKAPAVYFYSQQYNLRGEKRTRLGFMALLRLGDKDSGVFGHEHTQIAPKEDRLKLLTRVKASLSPIFVIFPDKKRIIQRIKEKYIQGVSPFIDLADEEKTVHKVWRLQSPEILKFIEEKMSDEAIFIADGHHRYEVACAFRDQMKQKSGAITGEEDFNYILAYFTNIDSRGLTILPIHRQVKLNSKPDIGNFGAGLAGYFDVEEIKERAKFFFLLTKAGEREHTLGMYNDKKFWLLRLKSARTLDKIICDKSPEYRALDVSILNHIVLSGILGLDPENNEAVTFSPDADELIRQASSDGRYIAFFLNPAKVQQITAIALSGEKMPPKSTYFYPKVLSGLVINKFD